MQESFPGRELGLLQEREGEEEAGTGDRAALLCETVGQRQDNPGLPLQLMSSAEVETQDRA